MPTRQMYINGNDGVVSIVNFSNPTNARVDPYNHLNDVYFHTSLQYIQFKQTLGPVNITLPQVDQSFYTYSSGGGCGGGCYITTACVEVMGLEDDCHELRALRRFRDKHMLATIENCMKVADYYIHAPAIVEILDKREDKAAFYQDVYEKFILKAVEAIDNYDYDVAMSIYEQGAQHCASAAGVKIA